MMKRVWRFAGVGVALFVAGATLSHQFAFYAPDSAPGWVRFRWEYENAEDKHRYLDVFRDRIWEHGGGYVPPRVARFLSERLESSADQGEVSAVTRFYSQQAGGREPTSLFDLSDKARRRIARTVLRDWTSYSPQEAQHGFVLLEGLRQNVHMGKANVILPHDGWADTPKKLAPVASLFKKWNSNCEAVPFTQRPDPLKGTPYSIAAP